MTNARRGEVWLVDLGMTAKVRPAVIFNTPFHDDERALYAIVPHTTALRGGRFEVAVSVQNPLLPKKLLDLPDGFDESVHFGPGVVEIKARARRGFHAQLVHERLGAVMAAAQRHARLVRQRHHVMRVDVFKQEADQAGAVLFGAKNPDAV